MIYYFDDDSKTSKVLTVGEEYDTADFDHPPCGGVDFDFRHPEGVATQSVLELMNNHGRSTHAKDDLE